jgi:hypothetical protein
MKNVQNTREVAYYRLHTQTKELDPSTEEGKKFARERSAELCRALQDVKEEMRAAIVKSLAKRHGLVAIDKAKIT